MLSSIEPSVWDNETDNLKKETRETDAIIWIRMPKSFQIDSVRKLGLEMDVCLDDTCTCAPT
ncbi:MAG: hypothetical protein EAX81_06875 [Candidatus Thorarchaeota archaeon]|nr:hypothetical protein [Candidatus Thorarchaeota archaeon]